MENVLQKSYIGRFSNYLNEFTCCLVCWVKTGGAGADLAGGGAAVTGDGDD